jgi:hypothetical protein
MSFSATIIVRTGDSSGPTYNIYGCVGSSCPSTPLNASPVTIVSDTPFVVQNIPFGVTSLKIESIGTCTNSVIFPIKNLPLPTPTPTPTPTLTPTQTLTPTPDEPLTPTPTPTGTGISNVTPTPTPTPTTTSPVTYGCGDTISDTTESTSFVIYTYNLNFNNLNNGVTINLNYFAGDRPNKFQVFDNNGVLVVETTWIGSDNTYYGGPWIYPENINPNNTGTISFTYNSSKTYTLTVLVGNANPSNPLVDTFTVNITCLTPPPPPTIYTYYLTGYRSKNDTDSSGCVDYYDFCVSPGYTTGTVVYTLSPTMSSLLNQTLYSDIGLTTPFMGQGTDGYYAVNTISGFNTYINNSVLVNQTDYYLLEINTSGQVTNLLFNDCDCDGDGGIPI